MKIEGFVQSEKSIRNRVFFRKRRVPIGDNKIWYAILVWDFSNEPKRISGIDFDNQPYVWRQIDERFLDSCVHCVDVRNLPFSPFLPYIWLSQFWWWITFEGNCEVIFFETKRRFVLRFYLFLKSLALFSAFEPFCYCYSFLLWVLYEFYSVWAMSRSNLMVFA